MQGSILLQFVTLLEERNGLAEFEQREYLWERVQKGKKNIQCTDKQFLKYDQYLT